MSIIAIPAAASGLPPLTTRPAPAVQAAGSTAADSFGTVVKMRQRPGAGRLAEQADGAVTGPAEQAGPAAGSGPEAARALDPMASERALLTEMTRTIALAALEVLSGVRSVQQLSRWLDIRCFNALTTRARLYAQACQVQSRHQSHADSDGNVRTLHHQPVVHSIHASAVAPGIYETNVVIADKTRFRAIAMRFEESHGTWKVTALQIG